MKNVDMAPQLNLEMLTDAGYRTALRITKDLITELEANRREGDQAIANAIQTLKDILAKETDQEVLLALLGEMSSGKTSLINAALGYPLFPVAKVTTSACPIEIRYGKRFKLQVFTVAKDQENVIFTFDDAQMLSVEKRKALLAYARNCVTSKVLVCENFDYYFDIRKGLADLDNTIHCAQLLLALLNGYVGQEYENVSERRQNLIAEREQLFPEIIGIAADASIGIRIWIDSSILRNGLTLVDLPGLGSDTKTHTEITTSYINRAHCCVMLFGLDGNAADNREALELMQAYEIMRFPGKSSRFILAINKCDYPYETEDYYSEAIEQAARSVYDTLHSIEIQEIIPISAWYAEYRYVRNGIDPERTMLGRRILRKGGTPEQILPKLERNYHTCFEYTDPHNDNEISYSTQKFLEETIGEYSVRIRYLNLARSLSAMADTYQETLSGLQVETRMIAMLEVLGSDLMRDLMGRMNDALNATRVAFFAEIDAIQDEMDDSRTKLADMLKKRVLPSYEEELARADKDLNDHMEKEVNKMQSDFFGHFCIDEMDDKSKANKAIFDKLKAYFESFDFNPYLKAGNTMLKDYLDRQRASYRDGVDKLAACFQTLPNQVDEALDKAFQAFLQSDRLKKELLKDDRGTEIVNEILNIYRKCFADAKNAITGHLFQLSQSMTEKIRANTLVEREIEKSVSEVYSFFNNLISTYHSHCAKYMDGRKKNTWLNDRPHLSVKIIRGEISIPFCAEESRKGYVGGLNEALIGQNADSHNSRMESALKRAMASFKQEASQKIGNIMSAVTTNIELLFGSGSDKIRYRYAHIGETVQIVEEAMARMESSEEIRKILDADYSWAQESVEAASKNLTKTHELLALVRDEVYSHIPSARSEASETQEDAAETEQV